MGNRMGTFREKVPPDNLEGVVRWVWDPARRKTWTNAWDRLICRPKAYELGISGVISDEAPKNDEFLRAVRDFKRTQGQNFSPETHFLNRGVQWGWRYDKGISEISLGHSIELVAVANKNEWIVSRTDVADWKRLSETEKRNLRTRIKNLENQLIGPRMLKKHIGKAEYVDENTQHDEYKQVQTECIKCFKKIGAEPEFEKGGNIIRCMRNLETPDWPIDWIEWVERNGSQLINAHENEKAQTNWNSNSVYHALLKKGNYEKRGDLDVYISLDQQKLGNLNSVFYRHDARYYVKAPVHINKKRASFSIELFEKIAPALEFVSSTKNGWEQYRVINWEKFAKGLGLLKDSQASGRKLPTKGHGNYRNVTVRSACIECYRKIGTDARFTKDGNIVKCMREKASSNWPEYWVEWVVQNAGRILKDIELEE